jgi:hypothetical protein
VFCFCPFSLSFLPPLSPITSLLFPLSTHLLATWFPVATAADPSLLIVILHTFQYPSITAFRKASVNYPAHRAGHLKKLDEGDCIPLPPAPHSSPSTGRGILREGFIKRCVKIFQGWSSSQSLSAPTTSRETGQQRLPLFSELTDGVRMDTNCRSNEKTLMKER